MSDSVNTPPTPISTVGIPRIRDLKQRDDLGFTRLHLSASLGDLNDVQHVIEKSEIDARSVNGSTPLILASIKGHSEVMELLLSHGANMEATTHANNTPLILACMHGHKEAVRILLNQGASTQPKNLDRETALLAAKKNGHSAVVALLEKNVQK
jgi:ankyrin repeat protein